MVEKPTYEELEKKVNVLQIENDELRKTKQAIEESESLHRLTLQNISDTVVITNDYGKIVYACPNAGMIFGLSQSQVYEKGTIQELVNGNVYDLSELGKGQEIPNIEWTVVNSSGRERFVLITVKSVSIKDGTVLFVIRDITERKQAEASYRFSTSKFEDLFNKAAIPLCIVNKETSTLKFNKKFEETFGWIEEDVSTLEEWWLLAYPDPAYRKWVVDTCYAETTRATETNTDIKPIEYDVNCKNGDIRRTVVFGSFAGDDLLLTFFDITERKQSEEALRKSQKMLSRTENITHLGSWEWEIATDTVIWSEELFRIFQIDPADGAPSWADHPKLYHPEDFEALQQAVESAVTNGTSYEIELRAFRKDGEIRVCQARGYSEFGKNGKTVRLFGSLHDVTESKQAEEELRQSEEKFYLLFENAPLGYQSLDENGCFLDVNQAWLDILGYERQEVIGKWFGDFLPSDLVDVFKERFKKNIQNRGLIKNVEFPLVRKDGSIIWSDYMARIGRDKDGHFLRTHCAFLDITDKKIAEQELRDSEEKYRSMMESLADPLYICSSDFTIEYMNPAMIRRAGRDAIGERCHFALHGLDKRCEWCVFDQVATGEKNEMTIKSPLDDRYYRVMDMPIHNKDSTISKMTIFRDITEYQNAISEKEKTQAQLIQAQKMEAIGNLAGGIAHDFNNILSSIIGFTELALDEASKGTLLEDSLQEVYSAGKRAKDLVKHILAFARQSDEERSPIQPRAIVKEVIDFIRSTIPTTIEIQHDIKSESLILGNSTQVHQILMNLCTNAAYAMEDSGGTLNLSLKDVFIDKEKLSTGIKPGDYIEIMVSDTGTGIAPEIIDSIFEPYFTTKAQGEGTGIGLAMVQGIIESYGGKINVESRLGKGATFTIYLPVTKKRSGGGDYVPEQIPMGTESILFVDDEAPIAKMGSQILERLGYAVTARTSSIEALELFQTKPNDFDLVITDMTMPNLTGDKLAVELMKIRPDIPVILCTGYSKKISDETATEIGIKAFIYKPVVKAELAKTVRKVLDEAQKKS